MGCICSKGVKDGSRVEKKKGSKKRVNSSEKDGALVEVDNGGNTATRRLMWTRSAGGKSSRSTPGLWEEGDKCHSQRWQPQVCRALSVRNGLDGSQVVAGWPSWLASVAGEAIRGWIPRKTESFEKLDKIGQGTYSSVYRARDLETKKVVALKKVRFQNMDPESVRFMAREILILRKLDHPNVMKLEGLVASRVSGNLYLVFEYMEHDLAGLTASSVGRFTVPQIKCFMQQLLRGLEHCHNRGVLHRDIKGSNLLIDKHGNLKIGDFGLATFFQANQKEALTSRVVTLWYRPPELLLGATDYGVAVDLWSSGCILAELFVGKPIMPGKTEVEQLHKIFKLCGSPSEEYWKKSKLPHATIFKPQQPYKRRVAETFKDFLHPSSLSLLESLLAFEPERRMSTTSALHSQFFTTMPLPCDPSSLPKYPPSKEYDVKAREEARRQSAAGVNSSRKGSKESKAILSSDPNVKHPASILKWKGKSEMFNRKGTGGSIFPVEPYRGSLRIDNVGPSRNSLNSQSALDSSGYREFRTQSLKPLATSRLSQFSNSVTPRGNSQLDLTPRGNSQLDFSRESSIRWAQHNPIYKGVDDAGDSSSHLLGKSELPFKNKEGQVPPLKENNNMGYALKKTQMHYSGPLLPSVQSVEEMLKEHEKQIQLAVRNARDKNVVRKAQQLEYGRKDM